MGHGWLVCLVESGFMTKPRRFRARTLAAAIVFLVALLATNGISARLPSPVLAQAPGESSAAAAGWSQTFDGRPSHPTPWSPPDWDVQVHSRDTGTFKELQPMAAHHGGNCSAPPDTHMISSYEDAVFQCNDHVMTSMYANG